MITKYMGRMLVLVASVFAISACAPEGSESQKASKVAEEGLKDLDTAAQRMLWADSNRKSALDQVFMEKKLPSDNSVVVSSQFFDQAASLVVSAKEQLEKAVAMNIFALQRTYYQLQIDACRADQELIDASKVELNKVNAFIAKEKGAFNQVDADQLKQDVASDEANIAALKKKQDEIRAKIDRLVKDNPGSFQPGQM